MSESGNREQQYIVWLASRYADHFDEFYTAYTHDIRSALIFCGKITDADGVEAIDSGMTAFLRERLDGFARRKKNILAATLESLERFYEDHRESVKEEPSSASEGSIFHEELISVSRPVDDSGSSGDTQTVRLSDNANYTGTKIVSFTFQNHKNYADSYSKMYKHILNWATRTYPEKIRRLAYEWPSTFRYQQFPFSCIKLENGIWANLKLNTNAIIRNLQKLFRILGISPDDLEITFQKSENEE